MAGASETLHEERAALSPEVLDRHRALASLQEELEAVDWYGQRAAATADPELKAILEHNGNEEKEHAAMVLEWLRRRDGKLDEVLREYLFSEGDVTRLEAAATAAGGAVAGDGSLGIGSLKKELQR